MRRRKIASVDQNTGEILEGVLVYCGVKYNPYSTGWVMNSQEALEMIAKDKEITGGIHRVLWFIVARLDFENWIQISQQEICQELGMKKQNVSSAIKVLEQKEIILRGPKIGKSYAFRLNPYFGWKGKVRNLEEYREEKYQNKECSDKIDIKEPKKTKKSQISEFSEEIKNLSKKYDIPLEKIQDLLEGGVLKLDENN